jgi:hypothetical protein
MPFEHREHVAAVDDQQLASRHSCRAGATLFAVDDTEFAEELAGMNEVEDDFLAGRRLRDDFDAALQYGDHRAPGRALGVDLLPRPITLDPGSRSERVDLARFELAEQRVALEQAPLLLMRWSGHRNPRKRYRYTNMIRPYGGAGSAWRFRRRRNNNLAHAEIWGECRLYTHCGHCRGERKL